MKKNGVDIVFVVLHYMAEETTIKCVEKIKEKIDTNNYKIVIVDNASINKSGKRLMERYLADEFIEVIINEKNLGFAKGNNVGFKYAKEEFNPDFIILMNNDVYIMENALMSKLKFEYEESNFAVLGPLIMTKDGRCNINPAKVILNSRKAVIEHIRTLERLCFLEKYNLYATYSKLSQILHFITSKKNKGNNINYSNYIEKQYNVLLHGCFLAFSKQYIERFEGLDDRTFLYIEEDILYKHMMENKLVTVYTPDILVYHEEDVSTDAIKMKEKNKRQYIYKCSIDSCKVLLDVYDYYEKKI